MAFLRNHQMFLQVFSKKVCFCCILGCFAEKKLPQMSQILTDGACLEFCEFCVLWEYCSPTDCTDQHRWLVALVVAWVRQDAIPSYICVNPCYLWEPLLYKKVLCRSAFYVKIQMFWPLFLIYADILYSGVNVWRFLTMAVIKWTSLFLTLFSATCFFFPRSTRRM